MYRPAISKWSCQLRCCLEGSRGDRSNNSAESELNDVDKVALPDSQSSQPEETTQVKCQLCTRTFTSVHGMKIHLSKCKKDVEKLKTNQTANPAHTPIIATTDSTLQPGEQPVVNPPSQSLNQIWGALTSQELCQAVSEIYEEVVYWRKNLFKLPSGAAGKDYIRETTKLIQYWTEDKQPISGIALKMVMIMPAILLQKPSRKSNAKQHTQYLRKRLQLWTEGNFEELMREARTIQIRLKPPTRKDETIEHIAKVFADLMLRGKVHAALRVLDKAASLGIAELTDETMKKLSELHPAAKEASETTLQQGELPYFDPVLFTNINEESIAKAAIKTRGAAGPSGLDADAWRRILISKNYGTIGKDLRTALAAMTQKLCMQNLEAVASILALKLMWPTDSSLC